MTICKELRGGDKEQVGFLNVFFTGKVEPKTVGNEQKHLGKHRLAWMLTLRRIRNKGKSEIKQLEPLLMF